VIERASGLAKGAAEHCSSYGSADSYGTTNLGGASPFAPETMNGNGIAPPGRHNAEGWAQLRDDA
jgi:hypothetical protein